MLERLELPRPPRVVSVAGTNGKGSTVAYLEAFYSALGHKVACYTSPHVQRFNERMRVSGRNLEDSDIVAAFRRVESVRRDMPLTYFEFGTLAALVAFADAGADVYVLEIGLGGRLDAVNAMDPDGAVITNVSLDHCDWLGHDVETIAREKAGVMRTGIPVIYGSPAVPDSVLAAARETGANLLCAGRDFHQADDGERWTFTWQDQAPWQLHKPALQGAFQLDNAAAALALFVSLEGVQALSRSQISAALTSVRLDGRMQPAHSNRQWLPDVAHNAAAAQALGAELRRVKDGRHLHAVIGLLADKDLGGLLEPLRPLVDTWIAVPADAARAMSALNLATRIACLTDRPCRIAQSIEAGLTLAEALSSDTDLILVTGSFYTVGPALTYLESAAGRRVGYTRGAISRDT